jgi:hypothetical protein
MQCMSQPDDAHIRLHSNFIHFKGGMNLNRLFCFTLKKKQRQLVKLELVQ